MNPKKWHSYRRIIALLLTIILVTGCSRGGIVPDGVQSTEVTMPQDYEVYKKETLDAQKAFDELCSNLFEQRITQSSLDLHYTLADPESYGIKDCPVGFGEFSLAHMKQQMQEMKEEKAALDAIPVNLLTDEQQVTYRILADSYNTELSSEGMELYYQPLGPTIGIQAQLPVLLSEYIFYDKQDVEDYLGLLAQTDEYYAQILAFEKERADAGLSMSDTWIDGIIQSCEGYLLTPERSFLSETFTERLATVPGLSQEEIDNYTARNLQVLGEDFIPAYQLLVDGLKELKGTGTNDKGMCYFPKGKEYYEYLVHSATGTTYETVDDLKAAIENQMDSDLIAMSKILKANPDIMDQLADSPSLQESPAQILDGLTKQIQTDFPALPECSYTIKYVPEALESVLSPAFYLTPPIDRYQNNTIYINNGTASANAELFQTLAHEGYPGHLYQTVYFSSKCKDDLRKVLSFSSYSEGWAFYVENYSYSLDKSMDSDLAQVLAHNASCSLGLHAVLDIYINYYGWTKEQVAEYLGEYYNLKGTNIVEDLYSTLVANPTNYLEYYVGYLEIVNMRNLAQSTLKKNFNLLDFHTFLLDMGPAPFTVIEPYFKTWLLTYDMKKN